MNFNQIKILFLLLLIPVLIILFVTAWHKRSKLISNFFQSEMVEGMILTSSSFITFLKHFIIITALALIIIAGAGPRWGYHFEEHAGRSASVIFILDISKSMLAEDSKPNRLDRAKREIFDMLEILQGERVALIGFAGGAYVQSPLTVDYSVLKNYIDQMNPDTSISSNGSDIGLAVNTAIKLFKEDDEGAIVLLTDGEDFEGNLIKEAQKAKDKGIIINSIGIGKSEGAPIPQKSGFKKDNSGKLIITRLNDNLLSQTADITGGVYVPSVASDDDIKAIYNNGIKNKVGEVEFSVTKKKIWEERFQWFLLPAILLLFIEQILDRLRGKEWTRKN